MTTRTKFDVASDELDKRIALLGNRLNCIGWMLEIQILKSKDASEEINERMRVSNLRGAQLLFDRAAIIAEKIKPADDAISVSVKLTFNDLDLSRGIVPIDTVLANVTKFPKGGSLN